MGILDNVKQMFSGGSGSTEGQASAGSTAVIGHVMDLVNNPETGGFEGLVAKFHSNGLGDLMNSWMGPGGAGRSLTADEISRVIGSERLSAMASKLGIQPDEVSNLVAQHLPDVISKLSPKTRLQS
jgi:uncharacterized protein YidB (DUF937 family)